jgi:type IV secretion system protein VirB9
VKPGVVLLAGGIWLAIAAGARAGEAPQAGPADARVRTLDYDPTQVVRIDGVYRTATQILFGEDETILHVALGDATAWEVAAEKNILFLKPKAAHGPTNLIVTTTRGGGQSRNYVFDLTAPATKAAGAIYVLHFRYPADLKTAAVALISEQERALLARLTSLRLERGAVEGPRNLAYQVQGAVALQPSEVSDNGRFTLMRFPAGQPVPSIYQVTSDGSESLVPFEVRGEFVVVQGIAKAFRLRRGRDVLCIYNQAPDPYGVTLGTHTASPAVERTDLPAPLSATPAPKDPAP